ncbi:transcriptional activator NhaR [Agarivorans sp. OAG1]|uniref:Transcriptional activator protein NhaR n=1 Tax=Agarivorans albus MKT 106 TaxID=1331007 RepID=R9PJW3_AGAAL|nr:MULTISPECIES: transcriptional activator NhaR [Agarivorans]MPW30778.1 transcriptional activator NhaR [Agarivorans sp. B2Z047]UQN42001.1 transcriptional activator NhaR [Agarivorans sp. B2Z047]BEU02129.1 transcriptional activator NhaR [Agarivorans sp. OAG1]GAD01548.1 transcriptional activator NhaR [Agarivorans albus MKT 106]
MSHLNYNHLYYFWMTYKRGSVTAAAEALFLTPQTVTGQIKQLEQRLAGELFIRRGPKITPTELGQLVYKYADRMFSLSYEMLDIVNYSQQEKLLFEVGVADALSKRLASRILLSAVPPDGNIRLRCVESTHELLLSQLAEHKLDMILSDCGLDNAQQDGVLSKKLGESGIAFFANEPMSLLPFPACLEQRSLLLPGRRSSLGRKLWTWFDELGLKVSVLGEFDDAALMKAFGAYTDGIFVAPAIYTEEILANPNTRLLGVTHDLTEEYHVLFAERMIQHPSVKQLCNSDFSPLFSGEQQLQNVDAILNFNSK